MQELHEIPPPYPNRFGTPRPHLDASDLSKSFHPHKFSYKLQGLDGYTTLSSAQNKIYYSPLESFYVELS